MTVDSVTFRKSLGNFASGVTVVTTFDLFKKAPVGVTISSFCSVSEDPPLVLFCLKRTSGALLPINANGHFAVNILGVDQQDLSTRFAAKELDVWDGISYESGLGNVPLLPGCIARLECSLNKETESGDHTIFIGLVEKASFTTDADPLLYFRSNYGKLQKG